MRLLTRLAFGTPIVILSVCGIVECLRLARAEALARVDTVPSLEQALRLAPGNAEYHARIAVLDATRNDQLDTALKLNPSAQSWWIMRSVHQEEENDLAGAEQSLKRANLVSQYYIPRWSLAAFYYRQGRPQEFLEWGRRALSAGSGSPESLFRMAQRLHFSSAEILEQLIPRNPETVAAYMEMVLRDGDQSAVNEAALKLLQVGTPADRSHILQACDSLFTAGKISESVALWNRAVQAGWIDLRPLDAATGKLLADETFSKPSLQMGFDWRYPGAVPGVAASTSDLDSSLLLEFSGDEPETCELLSQYVPLEPDRHYKLVARYRLDGIAPGSGLGWRVETTDRKQTLLTGLLNLPAQDFADQSFEFQTPPQPRPMRIVLAYSRSSGTTRIEGKLWLQSVKLELIP